MAGRMNRENFGTILDYLRWRGDLSFEADPWNDIDSLIMSQISYSNFGENRLLFDSPPYLKISDLATSDVLERNPQHILPSSVRYHKRMYEILPHCERYQQVRILDQVNDLDPVRNIQFSAMTLDIPGIGTVIAYRGTDPTVVGWKEDFMMSYATPVPAQISAMLYLEKVAAKMDGDLYLTGHSKGGNLAVYAAAHADREIQNRIRTVYSFDGPGLDDETMGSEGYQHIREKITSVIPAESVIGLLMNYHPVFRVVESTAASLFQHDPFTWKMMGKRFVEREQVSVQSQVMNQTMHEWLNICSQEQREIFVHMLFSLFEKKQKTENGTGEEPENRALDENSKKMVRELLGRLISIQAGNSYSARIRRPLAQAAEELKNKIWGTDEKRFVSDVVQIDNQGLGYQLASEEARKVASFGGLSPQNTLRLQLFAEEMMSMAHAITGEMQGTFWVEKVEKRYDLHLATRTVMDRRKRKMLIFSTTERKNEASRSFLGKLRDVFERAMTSGKEEIYYDLNTEKDQLAGDAKPEWDRYEQSVLLRLADNVRIAIRGDQVNMTISKEFSA